ncbi:MAG TPA: HIT family protein [Rhodospirillaceae bacterium]|nr:HIT family protein [Rhodospirillaceae bacterium]
MALPYHCIFCRIVSRDVPSYILTEDEDCIAFMDINPVAPGHVLIISKHHAENIFDIPAPTLQRIMPVVQRVALAVNAVFLPDGINLLQANGPGAAQSVPHFHVHVVPRWSNDGLGMNWPLRPGERSAIEANAERLRAVLR